MSLPCPHTIWPSMGMRNVQTHKWKFFVPICMPEMSSVCSVWKLFPFPDFLFSHSLTHSLTRCHTAKVASLFFISSTFGTSHVNTLTFPLVFPAQRFGVPGPISNAAASFPRICCWHWLLSLLWWCVLPYTQPHHAARALVRNRSDGDV